MSITQQDVVAHIKSLTVLELSELVKALEQELGVSAAAAMPAAAVGGDAGGAQPAAEQTEFDVVLVDVGPKRLQVIKAVREVTSLGLREAKGFVDEAPKPVKEGVPMDEAKETAAMFEEVGAKVEIR